MLYTVFKGLFLYSKEKKHINSKSLSVVNLIKIDVKSQIINFQDLLSNLKYKEQQNSGTSSN